jgi:hypothetical protein
VRWWKWLSLREIEFGRACDSKIQQSLHRSDAPRTEHEKLAALLEFACDRPPPAVLRAIEAALGCRTIQIMERVTVSGARGRLYRLLDEVAASRGPVLISGV